jgi:hypothetical protein
LQLAEAMSTIQAAVRRAVLGVTPYASRGRYHGAGAPRTLAAI